MCFTSIPTKDASRLPPRPHAGTACRQLMQRLDFFRTFIRQAQGNVSAYLPWSCHGTSHHRKLPAHVSEDLVQIRRFSSDVPLSGGSSKDAATARSAATASSPDQRATHAVKCLPALPFVQLELRRKREAQDQLVQLFSRLPAVARDLQCVWLLLIPPALRGTYVLPPAPRELQGAETR